MSHIRNILSSIASLDKRRAVEKQFTQDMPKLFDGYMPSMAVDVAYELRGHTPLRRELSGRFRDLTKEPVDSKIFNVGLFVGDVYDSGPIQALSSQISRDLRKLGCMAAQQNDVFMDKDGREGYKSFIGIPIMRPTGHADAPVFMRENDSLAKGMAYLMAKRADGKEGVNHVLATPKDIADTFGYTLLMDAVAPECADLLESKLKLDLKAALREAFAQDVQTGSRLMTYMLAHKRIDAETVEQEYGNALLTAACSKENVAWVRGLRGLPEGSLEEELPLAHKYVKERESYKVVIEKKDVLDRPKPSMHSI